MQTIKSSFPIIVPEGLKSMKVENVFFSPINENIGVAVLSEKQRKTVVFRLYFLYFNDEENSYIFTHELSALSFQNRFEAKHFLKRLPEMSALEILILMKPGPFIQ